MRILDIREKTIDVSRYDDPAIATGGLTASLVSVTTDAVRAGKPVVGFGYSSVGRFGQGGLIRERFAPRLLSAKADELGSDRWPLDPLRAWTIMMAGEKPGGHGERCVAVGTLDMAIWDAAAKIAGQPACRFIAHRFGREPAAHVRVYASGGYPYPDDDLARLGDEMRRFADLGFTHAKIKLGAPNLSQDIQRIETAARIIAADRLAVDAMNRFDLAEGLAVAASLAQFGLWWFEDVCDPLDFTTQSAIRNAYPFPLAAGEALFSLAEAKLLDLHGGLKKAVDFLVFDAVHCYGLPGYVQIIDHLVDAGWPRTSFWPHGGHLFGLHVAAALGLGGAEITPFAFRPFSGLPDSVSISAGRISIPDLPGLGFENHSDAWKAFQTL